jgi:hypothetical protein
VPLGSLGIGKVSLPAENGTQQVCCDFLEADGDYKKGISSSLIAILHTFAGI